MYTNFISVNYNYYRVYYKLYMDIYGLTIIFINDNYKMAIYIAHQILYY